MVSNKSVVFASIPVGYPEPGKDLVLREQEIDLTSIPDGAIATKNFYVSFDPYQRGRMRDPSVKSYSPAFAVGSVINNQGVGRIVASKNPNFKEGDLVVGRLGWEEYTIATEEDAKIFRKVQNPYNLPLSNFTSALGMPGLTAYSSLYKIGKPKKGETIFVSAASGAVGQIAGQLAKREGLTVIGSAGSDEKVDYITKTLGFDHAFNYKKISNMDALARFAPQGIDIYFDNVGGEALEAALQHANNHARFIECGMISGYNAKCKADMYLPGNLFMITTKRLLLQGFIVWDEEFGPHYFKEHQENVSKWLANGEIIVKENITEGVENAPAGFVGMLKGENFGKALLKVANE